MRIYEVDDRALVLKLKALIDHPSTNDNMRAIAKQRYDAIMLSQKGNGMVKTSTPGAKWAPKISATTPSGYPIEVSSSNWDNPFIMRDGHTYSFFQMIGKVRNVAPDEIEFTNGDQKVNKLNANRNTFNARSRPTMTMTFNEGAPQVAYVLDFMRQLSGHDWTVKASGRNKIEIVWLPDSNYEGDRKSA